MRLTLRQQKRLLAIEQWGIAFDIDSDEPDQALRNLGLLRAATDEEAESFYDALRDEVDRINKEIQGAIEEINYRMVQALAARAEVRCDRFFGRDVDEDAERLVVLSDQGRDLAQHLKARLVVKIRADTASTFSQAAKNSSAGTREKQDALPTAESSNNASVPIVDITDETEGQGVQILLGHAHPKTSSSETRRPRKNTSPM